MPEGSAGKLDHEVVLNTGGGSVLSSRVDEKTAGQVAMAFGLDWPSECVIRWPLLVRKVGVRPEIEGQALAAALRQIVEIPDGELVVWIAGKRGAPKSVLNEVPADGVSPILDTPAALAEVGRVLAEAESDDWGWIVKAGRAGEVLAK